jgi:hypothetical protein
MRQDDRAGAGVPADVGAGTPRIVRSTRRVRTAQAAVRDGGVEVRVPAGLDPDEEAELVGRVVARLHARASGLDVPPGPPATVASRPTRQPRGPRGDPALVARADAVADRWLGGVRAQQVTWSHRMRTRWASCTPAHAAVRVSHRLGVAPDHVLDNVLLHELAHLLERGHGPAFRRLMARDPRSDEARSWLDHLQRHELREALGR